MSIVADFVLLTLTGVLWALVGGAVLFLAYLFWGLCNDH